MIMLWKLDLIFSICIMNKRAIWMKRDLPSNDGWVDPESLLHIFNEVVVATKDVLTSFRSAIRGSLFLFFSNSMSQFKSCNHPRCTFAVAEVSLFKYWLIILILEICRMISNVFLVEFMFLLLNFDQSFSALSPIIHLRWTINASILTVVKRLHTAWFGSVNWWKIQILVT